MPGLSTSRLMDLKRTLHIMVDDNLIEESEMLNILNKAGLVKSNKEGMWVDRNGIHYTFQK